MARPAEPDVADNGEIMTDILDTLQSEHEALDKLLKKLNDTTDSAVKTRTELLAQIEPKLLGHAKGEEAVFYPAFAERGDHEDLQANAEAWQEHRSLEKCVLPDLKKADPGSRQFAGSAKVLMEFVEHHAKEEEGGIFASMRKLYSEAERGELDQRYKAWKTKNGF